jgi:hypothetical protein
MYHCSSIKIKPSFTSTITVPNHYYNNLNAGVGALRREAAWREKDSSGRLAVEADWVGFCMAGAEGQGVICKTTWIIRGHGGRVIVKCSHPFP